MPEYLAPGVYVEEVSYRSPSIAGVGTTTTGFVGPTRYGPTDRTPDILTSLADFEQTYGDGQPLVYQGVPVTNWMWQAARAFFMEGGTMLYVSRTYLTLSGSKPGPTNMEGHASASLGPLTFTARWPGEFGKLQVTLGLNLGPNLLGSQAIIPGQPASIPRFANSLQDMDIVWVGQKQAPGSSLFGQGKYYLAVQQADGSIGLQAEGGGPPQLLTNSPPFLTPGTDYVCKVTLSLTVSQPLLPNSLPQTWSGIAIEPGHTTNDTPDSVFELFASDPTKPQADSMPIIITCGGSPPYSSDGLGILLALLSGYYDLGTLGVPSGTPGAYGGPGDSRSHTFQLDGGDDGQQPSAYEYEGQAPDDSYIKSGLKAFEDLDDISIVAAPGATYNYELSQKYQFEAETINDLLIQHCVSMRYRIAIIDSGNQQSISQVREMRGKIDSNYAAFYYPWVRILDPITNLPLDLPPSGFVAGIYARNDINRAVYKAPANEVVMLAIGFEKMINKAQQEVLNPEGINCFRFFEDRGYRLWGARLATSDQEWMYVNLRRYFAYLEHSLDKGTQWAVFEPNNQALWDRMRLTIEPFMLNEFVSGGLMGSKPEEAFFIRCDQSTMTQNDLDNGRLVVEIGVAVSRPAEFVIIRIGQWTASSG